MKIKVFENKSELARAAAGFISQTVANLGGPLGLATGSTTEPIYEILCGEFSLPKNLEMFALDEYFEIDPDHPSSFQDTLDRQVVSPCGLDKTNLHLPPSSGTESEIEDFESKLKLLGPVSLQILGIGRNAHIAFNEPGSEEDSITRKVKLSETTKQDNAKYFEGDMPEYAVTQGISTIMNAKKLLLVATGAAKAEAVASIFGEGKQNPASMLSKHDDLTLMLDSEAASRISESTIEKVGE